MLPSERHLLLRLHLLGLDGGHPVLRGRPRPVLGRDPHRLSALLVVMMLGEELRVPKLHLALET